MQTPYPSLALNVSFVMSSRCAAKMRAVGEGEEWGRSGGSGGAALYVMCSFEERRCLRGCCQP